MEDVLRLIEEFQGAVCLWEDEVLIGFDEPAKAAKEQAVQDSKEALLVAILKIST